MADLEIEDVPSPNWGERDAAVPDMVVLHYTGMAERDAAIERLADPASEVSAHYVVTLGGRIVRMVAEDKRAWHAGRSAWGPVEDVNSHSIGVEIVNCGHDHGYHPFPDPQMRAVIRLVAAIRARWAVPVERVVGHSCVAPGRKVDPGEKFDWRRLALAGQAVWLDPVGHGPAGQGAEAARFQAAARAFGYAVPRTEDWDGLSRDYWDAFLSRFRPYEMGEAPHEAGIAHLEALARRWPCRVDAAAAAS